MKSPSEFHSRLPQTIFLGYAGESSDMLGKGDLWIDELRELGNHLTIADPNGAHLDDSIDPRLQSRGLQIEGHEVGQWIC